MAKLNGRRARFSVDMASSAYREDLLEEAVELVETVDMVDNRDEDFRDIITRGKNFRKPCSGSVCAASCSVATYSECREGSCVDASLLRSETGSVSSCILSDRPLSKAHNDFLVPD